MSGFSKVATFAAFTGAALGADRAAALTTINLNIAATDADTSIFLGNVIEAQYSYGGAAFKTASIFRRYGTAEIGSLSSTPGIDADDTYTSLPATILPDDASTLANDSYLRLRFVAEGETQLGYAAFNTAGTLTAISYKAAAAVPEPAAWAMLVTGFGAAGAAMRRRRREERLALAA